MKKGRISSLLYMFLFAFVLSLAMGGRSVKAENTGLIAKVIKYDTLGGYYVDLTGPGLSGSDIGFYRYNVATKEVKCIAYKTNYVNTDDSTVAFGETYVYYMVKDVDDFKTNSSYFPTLSKFETGDIGSLNDSEKQALEDLGECYKSNSVTIPAPGVGTAKWLSVNTGVKKASVVWYSDYDNDVTFITGYIVKRYNAAGAVDAQYNTTATSLDCPLPYEGSYAFTVTPYYVFKGKTYYGAETGRVGCASAQIYTPQRSAIRLQR